MKSKNDTKRGGKNKRNIFPQNKKKREEKGGEGKGGRGVGGGGGGG